MIWGDLGFGRGLACPGFYLIWTGSMWYEFLAFRQPAWLCLLLYCVSYLLCLGGGSTCQWRPFLQFFMVFSGGSPEGPLR